MLWRVGELIQGKNHFLAMESLHESNIFSMAFSSDNTYIYSAGKLAGITSVGGSSRGRRGEGGDITVCVCACDILTLCVIGNDGKIKKHDIQR